MLKSRRRFASRQLALFSKVDAAPVPPNVPDATQAWSGECRPGQPLWLCVLPLQLPADHAAVPQLQALAAWALTYTAQLHVEADEALLLEIGGSLRLFNGLEALRRRLQADLAAMDCDCLLACAPAAPAALWLARAGQAISCSDWQSARRHLPALPVSCLRWPEQIRLQLRQMGIHTLGDCLRLPRDGFARRVGPGFLLQLDQGFGRAVVPITTFRLPPAFHDCIEFASETTDRSMLANAAAILLERFTDFLRRRQLCTAEVLLQLEHSRGAASHLQIALREPASDAGHLLELLRLRLEREQLRAPVSGAGLVADKLLPLTTLPAELPGLAAADAATAGPAFTQLLERLRVRLGTDHVHGLAAIAEHRPEFAWQAVPDDRTAMLPGVWQAAAPRPLWLLEHPRHISEPAATMLADAPERIESGWWDGQDLRRDYYRITGHNGCRWWVFRDHRDAGWYLHGAFG